MQGLQAAYSSASLQYLYGTTGQLLRAAVCTSLSSVLVYKTQAFCSFASDINIERYSRYRGLFVDINNPEILKTILTSGEIF